MFSASSYYFGRAMGDTDPIADALAAQLEQAGISREAFPSLSLVGTGLSGTLAVPALARRLGTLWGIVRKEHSPHDSRLFVGSIMDQWIFVDDFVSSGATMRRVVQVVEGLRTESGSRYPTTYLGQFMYETGTFGILRLEPAE